MMAKSKTWQSVIEFYGQLNASPNWNPKTLENLALQIKNSEYACGLYPVTSMHVLHLGQSPEFDIMRGTLKLELKGNEIHLELMSSYNTTKNWKRVVKANEAFKALVTFLESEKWFVAYH